VSDSTRCRGCGRPIVFLPPSRPGGKPHPADPELLRIVTDEGQVVTGRRSHFATCPNADAFRAKRKAPLTSRAAKGFDIRTPEDLTVGHEPTLREAQGKRDTMGRLLRKRLTINWHDTGEVVTVAHATELLDLEPEPPPPPDTQAELELDAPDPRPNSPQDVGFDP